MTSLTVNTTVCHVFVSLKSPRCFTRASGLMLNGTSALFQLCTCRIKITTFVSEENGAIVLFAFGLSLPTRRQLRSDWGVFSQTARSESFSCPETWQPILSSSFQCIRYGYRANQFNRHVMFKGLLDCNIIFFVQTLFKKNILKSCILYQRFLWQRIMWPMPKIKSWWQQERIAFAAEYSVLRKTRSKRQLTPMACRFAVSQSRFSQSRTHANFLVGFINGLLSRAGSGYLGKGCIVRGTNKHCLAMH